MSYTPTKWKNGDVISSEKLNNIENGISENGVLKLYVYFDVATESAGLYYDEEHTQLFTPIDINGDLYDSIEDARAAYNRIRDIFIHTPRILLVNSEGFEKFYSLVKSTSYEQSDKYLYYSLYLNSGDLPLVDYTDRVTVTFNMQGHGEQIPPQEVQVGNSPDFPEVPEVAGWAFDGWYKEPECINAYQGDPIYSDTTLYAKWIEEQEQGNVI